MNNDNIQDNMPLPELPPPAKWMLILGVALKIWRKLENVAFVLLVVLLALYFVLQSAWVQNWLINRVTTYLSEELKTTVHVGHIDISFFDNLLLEQVYIADQHGDTLLFAGQLAAGTQSNFFSILSNKLEFNSITLSRAKVYAKRYEGEYDYNYDFILDYFSSNKPKDPNKKKTPFSIKVRNLRLIDITFVLNDQVSGQDLWVRLPKSVIQVNNFDNPSKIADFESISLYGPQVAFAQREGKPLPPKTPAAPEPTEQPTPPKPKGTPFSFAIKHLLLEHGAVNFDRFRASAAKTTPDGVMDFNHLALSEINFEADSLKFNTHLQAEGILKQLAVKEQSGFAIRHSEAKKMVADSNIVALYGFDIQTDHTRIGDTVLVRFNSLQDLKKFNDKVYLEVHLKPGTVLHPYDVAYFNQKLGEQPLLQRNKDLDIELSGLIKGKLNRLDGRNIVAKVGDLAYAAFDFDGEDLMQGKDLMRLEFDIQQLRTSVNSIKQVVPSGKIPSNLQQLGSVSFSGTYNMLFGTNHVVQGGIKSDIGYGDLDIKLDMSGGKEKASYSGQLVMRKFDLGAISGNKDLGVTAFNIAILPGSKGLTTSSMKANVRGRVDTLTFRGYTYKALSINGTVSESLFEGQMGIKDPNIDFSFDGKVNLKESTPIYVFNAMINRLDLGRLNWTKQDLVVSAKIDNVRLTGDNVADLAGVASVYDLKIAQRTAGKTTLHHIDSIRFESNFQAQNFRHFALRSDFLAASIDGNYTVSKVPKRFMQLISKYYPTLSAQLNLPKYDSTAITDLYRFGLYINNTKALTQLIDPQLDTIRNVSIGGQMDGINGISEMYAHIPVIKYGGREFSNIVFNWRSERNKAFLKLNLPSVKLSNKYTISSINLTANIKDDVAQVSLISGDTGAGVKEVNLKGQVAVVDSLWEVRIKDSKFDLFNLAWQIDDNNNYIRFGPKYIDVQGLLLRNGPFRRIALEGINNGKGLGLELTNFDLNFINEIVPTRGLTYSGKLSDFGIRVSDVFNMEGIEMGVATDTIFVNKKPYGRIDGNLSMTSLKHPLEWKISSHDAGFILTTTGAWLANGKNPQPSVYAPKVLQPKDLYAGIDAHNFPLAILQQIIPGVSKMEGRFDLETVVDGNINGKNTSIGLDGFGIIREGQFIIDYLNTPFFVKNQKVILTDDRIWAEKDTVYDATQRNIGYVEGGLRHNLFKKWKIDCKVWSDNPNFVVMDTKKTNNPLYYGKGVGKFVAEFKGTFSRTDIKVDATTGPSTKIFIPITTETESKEANFIKFKNDNKPTGPTPPTQPIKRFTATDLKGLSIEMNLTLTEQAEVQLIFNEAAGDIISGWGKGDISIIINREGDFRMYGNYDFSRGEYLFTLPNLVNKPFKMDRGGSVTWYGDPYDAQINIKTRYRENAPLTNLLQEELAIVGNNSLTSQAGSSTPVDLIMELTGDLFKPTITFGLEFPNIVPQLKTYVDNKLRLLQQDPNEINRQVFGLIIFGTFLPPDNFLPQSFEAQISTLTQFMSSQLSRYVSSLTSELLGGSVSNFDIDIDYQASTGNNLGAINAENRDLLLRMRSSFADERITIQVGTQFGLGNSSTSSTYSNNGFQGEDVVIEFQPDANSQWKLRVYQRSEPNTNIVYGEGLIYSFGTGITYSKDFDSFDDMIVGLKKWFKR